MNSPLGVEVLENFIAMLSPFWDLSIVVAYVIGLCLAGIGMYGLSPRQTAREGYGSTWALIAGALLLSIPTVLDMTAMTLFESPSQQTLSYSRVGSGPEQVFIHAAVYLVMLVGLWAIAKSLIMLGHLRKSQSPGLAGQIATHFFGGIICVNIVRAVRLFGSTFGGDFQTTITSLIG